MAINLSRPVRLALLATFLLLVALAAVVQFWPPAREFVGLDAAATVTATGAQWDTRLDKLRVYLDTQGVDYSKPHWKLVAAWCTVNGSWEQTPREFWPWIQNVLGGDHHVYGLVDPADADQPFILGWPDGSQLITPRQQFRVDWADEPTYATYDPTGPGPYSWGPAGNTEMLRGIGLPYYLPWAAGTSQDVTIEGGIHVSVFGVWRLTQPAPPTVAPPATPTPEPTATCEWTAYHLRFGPVVLPVELRER